MFLELKEQMYSENRTPGLIPKLLNYSDFSVGTVSKHFIGRYNIDIKAKGGKTLKMSFSVSALYKEKNIPNIFI